MKKTILSAILLLGITTSAFAAQVGDGSGDTIGATLFKTSTNVALFAASTDTAYTCASKHKSGDTVYTSTGDSATITEVQDAAYKGIDITDEDGSITTGS